MVHPIYRVRCFEIVSAYTLRIQFDDGAVQTINFQPILTGEMYGPLRNLEVFKQVQIDSEAGTLVWPNGADFDPATLHDWPAHERAFRELASRWEPLEA
ncbi:MAG: DUF2442 domain-containing protein [Terriglobales bacterium]|jgi:hypothetical protein